MTLAKIDCGKCGMTLTQGQVGNRVKRLQCCDSEERFWYKLDKSGGENACWPFKGAKHRDGYGRAHILIDGQNRIKIAHRLAYEFAKGPIAEGMDVLHSCDNRICCNPAHLSLGTHTENMIDMRRKGRCSRQVFTPVQVLEVRALLPTMGNQELAKHFGVGHDAIWRLRHGRTYQWVK